MMKKPVLTWISSVVALSPIGWMLPSVAANLSFSSASLNLSNFSLVAQDVVTVADIDSFLIVEEGKAQGYLQGDSLFVSDSLNSQAYAYSQWQSLLSGFGSEYVSKTDIFSQQYGSFNISAGTTFSFELQASVLLLNQKDDYFPSFLSSLAQLNLTLRDEVNQKNWQLFNFEAILNSSLTDSSMELSPDIFGFQTSPDLNIHAQEFAFVGGEDKGIQLSFDASGEIFLAQQTQLSLLSTTRICNYSASKKGGCSRVYQPQAPNSVPEPSSSLLSLVIAIFFFAYQFWRKGIIK